MKGKRVALEIGRWAGTRQPAEERPVRGDLSREDARPTRRRSRMVTSAVVIGVLAVLWFGIHARLESRWIARMDDRIVASQQMISRMEAQVEVRAAQPANPSLQEMRAHALELEERKAGGLTLHEFWKWQLRDRITGFLWPSV